MNHYTLTFFYYYSRFYYFAKNKTQEIWQCRPNVVVTVHGQLNVLVSGGSRSLLKGAHVSRDGPFPAFRID